MIVRSSIALIFFLTVPLIVSAQRLGAKKELAQIERIYVEDDPYETPDEKSIKPLLQAELKKNGFIVAPTKDEADATLTGEGAIEITLHPKRDSPPDKAIYVYKLLSRKRKLLWKHTVKFVAKGSWLDNNKVGAQKIVEKLTKDLFIARQ